MTGDSFVDMWNGFLITAGLGTIGVLLVVLPLVLISIAKTPRREEHNEEPPQDN